MKANKKDKWQRIGSRIVKINTNWNWKSKFPNISLYLKLESIINLRRVRRLGTRIRLSRLGRRRNSKILSWLWRLRWRSRVSTIRNES